MIDIIAHRGFWVTPEEKNMRVAFMRAIDNGFGIETDLRDYGEKLVISHDIPNESSLSYVDFLKLVANNKKITLALNVKSDGLQKEVHGHPLSNPHFFFDMSIPDMLGYMNVNLSFYTRYSNLEKEPILYSECCGVWVDNFIDDTLDLCAVDSFLNDGKYVALVSPELHGREYDEYWSDLKQYLSKNIKFMNKVSICTDFPDKAREYFK